jgi:hypothetical protein
MNHDETVGMYKVIVICLLLVLGLGATGVVCSFCGEGATVAQTEFGPKAALQKYEWFKEQSSAISKMDQDIDLFKQRVTDVEKTFVAYGDKAKWPLDVRYQYNQSVQQGREDLLAVISQRNNLVKEYNAASSKFNWSLFQAREDAPAKEFTVK